MSVQALQGPKEHGMFFGPRGKSTLAYKDGETKENVEVGGRSLNYSLGALISRSVD
jgi:hypothetical protein